MLYHHSNHAVLRSIFIRDFALIESLELLFGNGFTVITGETGAGKSIIIDAFLAALGERTSGDTVRAGAAKSIIELQFQTSSNAAIAQFLREHDFDENENSLVIRREIRAAGTSRFFVNDTPATASIVRELGTLLVDFHGQYEHQSILRPAQQVRIVDRVAHNDTLLRNYRSALRTARDLDRTIREVQRRAEDARSTQEYQRSQLEEIARIDPKLGEEEELVKELDISTHAEELHEQTDIVYGVLYAGEQSVSDNLARVQAALRHLGTIDAAFLELSSEIESAGISVAEVAKAVQRYRERVDFHPARIEEVRERLAQLQRLRKRYGSIERACREREILEESLRLIDNFDDEMQRLSNELAKAKEALAAHGRALHRSRLQAAEKLSAAIEEQLHDLGIPSARFAVQSVLREAHAYGSAHGNAHATNIETSGEHTLRVSIDGKDVIPTDSGADDVVMRASMNAGEELKPLEKVLSGGEASRVMLSVKSVMADTDDIPILVFDEIDTGISGRVAKKVGVAIKALAQSHQVLAITHQALIASLAHHHVLVRKHEHEGRTHVHAETIAGDARVAEIAALLSGDTQSQTARARALELLAEESEAAQSEPHQSEPHQNEPQSLSRKTKRKQS
jgi:DNA repair protein RecN (Recombination protein N)